MATLFTAFESWKHHLIRVTSEIGAYEAAAQSLCAISPYNQAACVGQEIASFEQIANYIDEIAPSLVALEQRVQHARLALQALRNRFVLSSPINRLPTEMLSSVFLLGHSEEKVSKLELAEEEWDLSRRKASPDAWVQTVSSVCRHWRKVSILTGALWTSVELSKSNAQISLERSGKLSLDVTSTPNDFESTTLQDVVLHHSHRLSSLTIDDSKHVSFRRWRRRLDEFIGVHESPVLRKLTLLANREGDPDGWTDEDEVLPASYRTDPLKRLTHLHLRVVCFPWQSVVFTNLVSLKLRDIRRGLGLARFVTILRLCPGLDTLELDAVYVHPANWDDEEMQELGDLGEPDDRDKAVITLPHLRVLRLIMGAEQLSLVLRRISAPALDLVSVGVTRNTDDPSPLGDLSALLARRDSSSPSQVTRLSLNLDYIRSASTAEVVDTLNLLPHLKKLRLQTVDFDNELIEALGPFHSPRLVTLELILCEKMLLQSFVGLLQARAEAGHALEQLTFCLGVDQENWAVEAAKYVGHVQFIT